MLNTMVIIKMNNCTYDEWKKAFDADSASDAQFMRDVIVGKVDDHTAICSMDVFDPEKMQAMFEDPEMKKLKKKWDLCMRSINSNQCKDESDRTKNSDDTSIP